MGEALASLKTLIFVFTLSLLSKASYGSLEDSANFSISCNGSFVRLSLRASYAQEFTEGMADTMYVVDPSDSSRVEDCRFTLTGDLFILDIDENNVDACFVETEGGDGVITNTYVAALFPTPLPGQVVSFEQRYCWTFQCNFEDTYNVSTGSSIVPFKPNFNATITERAEFNVTAEFYTNDTYTETTNPCGSGTGIPVGDDIFLLLKLTGSPNLHLTVPECDLMHVGEEFPYDAVENGCPEGDVPGLTVSRRSSQEIAIEFPAFRHNFDTVGAEQFFTMHCQPEICDSKETACDPDPVCPGRRRRSVPSGSGTTKAMASASFQVTSNCDLHCDHICKMDEEKGYYCDCGSGYILKDDGLSCEDVQDVKEEPVNDQIEDEMVPQTPPPHQPIHRPYHKEESERKSDSQAGVFGSVKSSTLLFYSSIVVIFLLCILLVISVIQRCRKPQKPYQIMDTEVGRS